MCNPVGRAALTLGRMVLAGRQSTEVQVMAGREVQLQSCNEGLVAASDPQRVFVYKCVKVACLRFSWESANLLLSGSVIPPLQCLPPRICPCC